MNQIRTTKTSVRQSPTYLANVKADGTKAQKTGPATQVGRFVGILLILSFFIASCTNYQHPDLEIRQLGFQLTPEQEARLDTAKAFARLKTIKGTKHQLDSLLTWTDMLKDHDEERALIYANEAYRLATEKNYRLSRAIAMYYRALLKGRGGILGEGVEDALADAKISNRLIKSSENIDWQIQIKGLLGILYYRNRDFDRYFIDSAAFYERAALDLTELSSLPNEELSYRKGLVLLDLANIHFNSDSLDVVGFYEEGLTNVEISKNLALLSRAWISIGDFYDDRDDFHKADSAFQVALEYSLRAVDPKGLRAIYQNLGNLNNSRYYKTKQDTFFERSLHYLERCLELHQDFALSENLYYTYEVIGYNYHDKFSFRKNKLNYASEGDSAIKYYGLTIAEARREGALKSMKLPVKFIFQLCADKQKLTGEKCSKILGDVSYDYQFINENYVALTDTLRNEQLIANAQARTFERNEEAALSDFRARRNWLISGTGLVIAGLIFLVLLQRQQQQRLLARMDALRAQINPHFMSNSLNAIENLVNRNENEAASKYLIHFSRLSRKILSSSRSATISLSEELKTLEHFLALEQLRFRDKLQYNIEIGEAIDPQSVQIPALILQPYVENAIWHGIKPKTGPSFLLIKAEKEGKQLKCTIEDDGVGRKKAQALKDKSILLKHKSQGMKITEERLQKIGKVKGSKVEIIDLYDNEGTACGTCVIIRIPLKKL